MSVALYTQFDQVLNARESDRRRRYMPYEDSPLPNPLFMVWMAYAQMHREFIRELANIINTLSDRVERLRAWADVGPELDDIAKMEAGLIAIDDLATISLTCPTLFARGSSSPALICHIRPIRRCKARPGSMICRSTTTSTRRPCPAICEPWLTAGNATFAPPK